MQSLDDEGMNVSWQAHVASWRHFSARSLSETGVLTEDEARQLAIDVAKLK
jgi:hypothetical protein